MGALKERNTPFVVLPGSDFSFQVLIGPSRPLQESPTCDKLKYQKWYLEELFVLKSIRSYKTGNAALKNRDYSAPLFPKICVSKSRDYEMFPG